MSKSTKDSNERMINLRRPPKLGEIWWCRLEEKQGSVQNGYRPVFISSNNKNNVWSNTVNVIPITKMSDESGQPIYHDRHHLPVHVELIKYRRFGLSEPSMLKVEQITTVDKESFGRRIGRITDSGVLNSIGQALRIQLPFIN